MPKGTSTLKSKNKELERIIAKLGRMKLDTKKMVTNAKVSTVKSKPIPKK